MQRRREDPTLRGYEWGFRTTHAEYLRKNQREPPKALRRYLQEEPWVDLTGGGLPCPVRLHFGRDRHGRVLLTGLRVEGFREDPQREVTAMLLRQIGSELTRVLQAFAERQLEEDPQGAIAFLGRLVEEDALPYAGVAVRPGRKGHTDEYLHEVARGYRQALSEDPQHPFSLLARRLFKSEAQTRRLVKRALELFPDDGEEASEEGGHDG